MEKIDPSKNLSLLSSSHDPMLKAQNEKVQHYAIEKIKKLSPINL